ncbi:MAG: SgcJ/EcaC family oxidoreductase [Bacteroidetes bacterium]|nr:SgcJ/EcaC family oxidoreductase [Bacteroidota bacterium]
MSDENDIRKLYHNLLQAWNENDAKGMSELCTDRANFIGFDGSQHDGKENIEKQMQQIFTEHKVNPYVYKVREVRFLNSDSAILRSVVSMVNPEGTDIIPQVNAVQTLVAAKHDSKWLVEIFQNTPAAFGVS